MRKTTLGLGLGSTKKSELNVGIIFFNIYVYNVARVSTGRVCRLSLESSRVYSRVIENVTFL